jgi:hypothetical protein
LKEWQKGNFHVAEEMKRFEHLLSSSELKGVLGQTLKVAVQNIGETANLEPVEKTLKRLNSQSGTKRTDYDLELCEVLHKQLKHLPVALKVDMRFWQWMAVERFPDFVWLRWHGEVPEDVDAALSRGGMAERFLGNRTLRGRNRNALSRLFFTADILYDNSLAYKLATSAFANQDRHQAIFERAMGLVPAAAKALIRATRGLGSEEIKSIAKRLNHIGSSLVLETVDEKELLTLLK